MVPRINGTTLPIPPATIAQNMHVNFNFQFDPMGNPRPEQQFAVLQLLENRNNSLDYAIVRLAGNPGNNFGRTRVSPVDAAQNDAVGIIGHPDGLPKVIEAGVVHSFNNNLIRYNDIDTRPGNSGSGILHVQSNSLVGVHTNGGCAATSPVTGFNLGQRVSHLIDASPILTRLCRLWVIQNNRLHRVNPQDFTFAHSAPEWDGPTLMAARGEWLYVYQNSRLHQVDPRLFTYPQVSGPEWAGATSMAASGDRLFIIQDGKLHRVNPDNFGDYQHSAQEWSGATSMCALGDWLFIVQNNRLHRVNPADFSYTPSGPEWDGVTTTAAFAEV